MLRDSQWFAASDSHFLQARVKYKVQATYLAEKNGPPSAGQPQS